MDVKSNDYDLSINKYKQRENIAVEYHSTQEIMAELRGLEKEITIAMDKLERMLK